MKWLGLSVLSCVVLSTATTLDCSLGNYEAIDLGRGLWLHQIANLQENTVTMQLTFEGNSWLSIGPSRTGRMVVSDAVIGIPNEDDEHIQWVNPGKYRMTTESSSGSGVNLLPPWYQTLRDSSITQNSTHTVLRFTKKLEEDDELSISKEDESIWIYAVGRSNTFPTMHARHGVLKLTLNLCVEVEDEGLITTTAAPQTTNATVVMDVSDDNLRAMWITHGVFMALAWGVLAPLSIGVALARDVPLAKRFGIDSWWLSAHRALNLLVVVFTNAGLVLAFVANSINTIAGEQAVYVHGKHGKTGLVVVALMVVQVLSGFLRPPKWTSRRTIKLDDGLYKDDFAKECDTTGGSFTNDDSSSDYDDPVFIKEVKKEAASTRSFPEELNSVSKMSPLELQLAVRAFLASDGNISMSTDEKVVVYYDEEEASVTIPDDKYTPVTPQEVLVSVRSWGRYGWEIFHRATGLAILGLALYNCDTGIQEHANKYGSQGDWSRLFWILTGSIGGGIFLVTYICR